MRILGLDLSSVSSGFAIIEDGKLIDFGKILEDNPNNMVRLVHMTNRIKKIVDNYQFDKVIIEDVYYGNNFLTTKVLNRLGGMVYYAITNSKNMPTNAPEFVGATQARKALGLLPKSTKVHIVRTVNQLFNKEFKLSENDITY